MSEEARIVRTVARASQKAFTETIEAEKVRREATARAKKEGDAPPRAYTAEERRKRELTLERRRQKELFEKKLAGISATAERHELEAAFMKQLLLGIASEIGQTPEAGEFWYLSLRERGFDSEGSVKRMSLDEWVHLDLPVRVHATLSKMWAKIQ